MTKDDFFNLLTEEVKTYKNFLETANNEWIVKGFIDVDKNSETRPISDGFRNNNVNYWAFREIRSIIPHL